MLDGLIRLMARPWHGQAVWCINALIFASSISHSGFYDATDLVWHNSFWINLAVNLLVLHMQIIKMRITTSLKCFIITKSVRLCQEWVLLNLLFQSQLSQELSSITSWTAAGSYFLDSVINIIFILAPENGIGRDEFIDMLWAASSIQRGHFGKMLDLRRSERWRAAIATCILVSLSIRDALNTFLVLVSTICIWVEAGCRVPLAVLLIINAGSTDWRSAAVDGILASSGVLAVLLSPWGIHLGTWHFLDRSLAAGIG